MNAKTINVSFPPKLLKKIDRKAKEEFRSRSELLKEAILAYIQTKDNWKILQKDLSNKASKMGLKSEKDIEKMVDSLRK